MLSREHIIWGYRILLGRDPENEAVVQDKMKRLASIEALRNEFLASEEFYSNECQSRRRAKAVSDEYFQWAGHLLIERDFAAPVEVKISDVNSLIHYLLHLRTTLAQKQIRAARGARVLLLGNCQTGPLASVLAHMSGFQVEAIREDILCNQAHHGKLFKKVHDYDVVLSQPLSADYYGPFQTLQLTRHVDSVVVIPNIYFSGLQPDLIYVGQMRKRYLSPVGDYHSAIAIAAFLEKYSPEQAALLYRNQDFFQRAGLLDEWQQSIEEMRVREFFCDIKLSDDIYKDLKNRPLFYAPNHPTLELINLLSGKILSYLGCNPGWISFWRDDFQQNVIYPVWDVIAEHHDIGYRSPEMFFLPISGGAQINLLDYLQQAFKLYKKTLPKEAALYPKIVKLRALL